jgi:hypothetical protein
VILFFLFLTVFILTNYVNFFLWKLEHPEKTLSFTILLEEVLLSLLSQTIVSKNMADFHVFWRRNDATGHATDKIGTRTTFFGSWTT